MLKQEQRLNILAFGVFDLPRAHHVGFFRNIKEKFPDSLLKVGIISDQTIRTGKYEPYLPDIKRKIILEASKYVDHVFITDSKTIDEKIFKAEDIDLVCKSANAEDLLLASEVFITPKEKQVLVEIDSPKGVSISDLRDKINATKQYAKK